MVQGMVEVVVGVVVGWIAVRPAHHAHYPGRVATLMVLVMSPLMGVVSRGRVRWRRPLPV